LLLLHGVDLALGFLEVVAHGGQRRVGQGLVARPWSASPPPASEAWAMAWALSGARWSGR
jgi:hypothetical protein